MPESIDRRLGPIRDAQLLQNHADIVAHRALGQVQPLGDLGIAQRHAEQDEDRAFALRQDLVEGQRIAPRTCRTSTVPMGSSVT